MKKPWEKGYIPKPGAKPGFKGVETPEGWTRDLRTDCVEFYRMGARLWTHDRIIGQVGKPWKLWFNHNAGVFRQPDMVMPSLKALLVWYQVEQANQGDDVDAMTAYNQADVYANLAGAVPMRAALTNCPRQTGKSAALAAAYGMSAKRFGEVIHLDFKSLEERTLASLWRRGMRK